MANFHFASITYAVVLIACAASAAYGQTYPLKTIRVVTSDIGGGNDLQARVITQGLAETLGWTVIVDNRGGAGGEIAMETVARAAPDGYTLLFYGSSLWTLPLIRKVSFDPIKDFAPISMATTSPNVLVVNGTLPVKSVRELISLARSRPGQLSYASGGVGAATHLAAALFTSMTKTNVLHVPYKGNGPAYTDLTSGQVQIMFMSASASSLPQVKAGRLRILAITSTQPSALFPGVPLVADTVPGYSHKDAYGLLAPARTPEAVVKRLNEEVVRLLGRAEIRERYLRYNVETAAGSPEQFGATIAADTTRLGQLIRDAGIRAE